MVHFNDDRLLFFIRTAIQSHFNVARACISTCWKFHTFLCPTYYHRIPKLTQISWTKMLLYQHYHWPSSLSHHHSLHFKILDIVAKFIPTDQFLSHLYVSNPLLLIFKETNLTWELSIAWSAIPVLIVKTVFIQ